MDAQYDHSGSKEVQNKWFSTYISRIFGFHSRLKSEKAKSEKVYTPA